MALNPGELVDQKYRIVRLLGEGGMGAVYEGENTRIHRRVALKVLHSTVADSADAVQRFEREAQAAGRIGSDHIVEVLDLGHLPTGDRYMVMEYLEGQSLSQRLKQGRLVPQVLVPIARELLDGLQAAHDVGIIHRDLKPDNVFLLENRSGKKDFVKILDFGISKFSTLGGEFSMTRTGAIMGTPYYMSPEQAKGSREVDQRTDLYAVGVILYEATAGEVPFNAETFNELLFKIVLENPAPLVELVPGLDARFAEIVHKTMARDPAERFQSARELSEALGAWLADAPGWVPGTLSQGTPRSLDRTELAGAGAPRDGADNAAPEIKPTVNRQKTQQTWAASGQFPAAPAQEVTRWPRLAGALVAVLALAGGGIFYVQRSSGESEEARVARERAEEQEKAAAARRTEELAREAERARAEAEEALARAEKANREVEATKSAAEEARRESERLAAEKLASEQAAARTTRPPARPARTGTSTASSKPDTQSSSSSSTRQPAAGTSPAGGRMIRTDL